MFAAVFPKAKGEAIALPMVEAARQRDRAARIRLGFHFVDWERVP